MSAGASGAAGAAVAAMIQAIKASGVIVRVDPENFLQVVTRQEAPLVVCAPGNAFLQRWFRVHSFSYLTSYKGLAFHTTSREHLPMPDGAEVILAKSIWIPG
jgi:hypothetical protein